MTNDSLNEWRDQRAQERLIMLRQKAAELGCPENTTLAEYVLKLEERLDYIEGFLVI